MATTILVPKVPPAMEEEDTLTTTILLETSEIADTAKEEDPFGKSKLRFNPPMEISSAHLWENLLALETTKGEGAVDPLKGNVAEGQATTPAIASRGKTTWLKGGITELEAEVTKSAAKGIWSRVVETLFVVDTEKPTGQLILIWTIYFNIYQATQVSK